MATILDQQVALDEALVPSAQRLRIGRSNFQLPSDIQSKEPTLQVVYDVLRNSPFFRAFLVTADVPEIYMQEFWATAKLHQHSIRFKMDTRKHVLDLEAFREMLHISPRIPGQSFTEFPFEEEILEFLRFLGHSTQIKTLTDVNVNKLYQPWRSFATVINKCLTGKSSGIDSLRISQAQILWGLYNSSNVDYAYLSWEDFVYQVEHKSQKKINEMYYPRFTKVIIDYFMTWKPSIPRRNRVNWHYVRDDTDESDDDDDEEETTKIGKQEVAESDEGDDEATESDRESEDEETREQEEESFDPIHRTPEDNEDDDNNEEDQGLRTGEEERMQEEKDAEELYHDVDINQGWGLQGLYHRSNVDYAYLIWEDFVYQLEHKNQKKSNEMYYPRFTKVIVDYFTKRKPSIPRRNKINWHYVRDDILFSTIKVVSRHQNTQQYGAILPIELTTKDIRNTKAYKEYYACAIGEAAPKPKTSARKKKGGSASSNTPPTPIATQTPTTTIVVAPRLSAVAKGKQPARATTPNEPTDVERTEAEQLKIVLRRSRQETHISQQHGSGTDKGTGSRPWVPDVPSDDSEEELSWNSFDDEDVDEQPKGRDKSKGDKTNEIDDDDDDPDEAEKVNDDDDDEEEISKIGEQEATESDEGDDEATESDRESEDEETKEQEEESFDLIP
nr:hypothetical protein [Tanacetum cinerariifolium]